jgi:hypothetical protein
MLKYFLPILNSRKAGPKAGDFTRGREKIELLIQASPERPKPKPAVRKARVDEVTVTDSNLLHIQAEM